MPLLRPRLSAALLAILLPGCATFHTPAEGGRPWREAQTAHFRILTDLDESDAERTARKLEVLRLAVLAALEARQDPPNRLEAVIFSSPHALDYFDSTVDGAMSYGVDPFLVSSSRVKHDYHGEGRFSVEIHEMAHHLTAYLYPRQPRWIAEGLATFLETAQLIDDDRAVVLGHPVDARLAWVRYFGVLPLDDLWRWEHQADDKTIAHYYGSAWIRVHFLLRSKPTEFARFLAAVAAGQEPRGAWDRIFPPDEQFDLDLELGRHLSAPLSPFQSRDLPSLSTSVAQRVLEDWEVRMVRARLWLTIPCRCPLDERLARASEDVHLALQAAPSAFAPLLLKLQLSKSRSDKLAIARELVRSHPDNPRGWTTLMQTLPTTSAAERRAALDNAQRLAGDDPVVLDAIATELTRHSRAAESVELARRAVAQAPWQATFVNTLAAALAADGRCAEAIDEQQRAISVLPEGVADEERRRYLDRLARYRSKCAPVTPVEEPVPKALGTDVVPSSDLCR